MERRRRSVLSGVGAGALAALTAGPAGAGGRDDQGRTVVEWIDRHAVPLATTVPEAPLDDLAPLRRSIGGAEIVGLGESVHGAAEEIALKHRILRFLVEAMGFRSIAWEEDWAVGRRLDAYIRGGEGDPAALVRQMSPQWQAGQVADVLRWLRAHNAGRADQVQLVGVEYYLTGPAAYDAVEAYVAGAAPARLAELRDHLQVIRPTTPNIFLHIQRYTSAPDKAPYLHAARAALALVDGLPHAPGDRAHVLAVQQARQIVSFYEHFSLPESDALVYRDAHAARNLQWWRDFTGDKVAYWAASPHTANAPQLRIAVPPDPDWRFPSAGSYLRRRYGPRYVSIGFTFDHGTVRLGPDETIALPSPAEGWSERPFGQVGGDQFALDLQRPAPPPVRRWLEAPIKTRGLADRGPDSYMDGGSLAQWFDVIVHRQAVTPVLPA
jgi:erythromycin esterase